MFPAPQSYFPTNTPTSIIYLLCIASIFVAFISLPYLNTDVSVRSSALIRPASEVNIIRSIASGRVLKTFITENIRVKAGDPLYVLESETLNEQENFFSDQIALTKTFIQDAESALAFSSSFDTAWKGRQYLIPNLTFATALYRQSYFTYSQRLTEALTVYTKTKQAFDRQDKLYKEKVIAEIEFENFQFELHKAKDLINQISETQRSQWQIELRNLEDKIRELSTQLKRIQKEKDLLTITAPINGTIQNLTGVYTGSLVFANQELGQISPDTSILVLAFVQPNDIGFIKRGMRVRLQVDAFNYNQWGMANGTVTAVPQDIKIIENKPVFEVRCSLDKDFLQLKNGYKGYLKKGMTLQARFLVAERTLWQLLYDKVDDWMNPNLE